MKVEDVVNPQSRFETHAIAEFAINEVKQGEIIQLERRGYFYVDKLAENGNPIHLHFVPDGKTKNISVIETKINVKALSKGAEKEASSEQKQQEVASKKKEKKAEKAEKKAEKKANKEAHMAKLDQQTNQKENTHSAQDDK